MRIIPLKGLIACGILCLWLSAGTAWAAEVNVALGKPTSGSSVWEAASSPDKVVDGVTNLGHPNHFHSGGGDVNPWWRVELGQEYLLKKIVVWNRVDCCKDRLQDITVRVLGPGDIVLFETVLYPGGTTGAAIPDSVQVSLGAGVPGVAVRVSRSPSPAMSGDNAYLLQLAEVQVIADVPPGVSGAFSPSPAVNAVRVGTAVANLAKAAVTFGWSAAVTGSASDPNILVVDPKLVSHKLYLSNGTNDPNVFLLATIPAGNPVQASAQYGPVELNRNATYFWRVDEIRLNNSVQETITGALWKFQTETDKPIINSIAPSSLFAWSVESGASTGRPAESAAFIVQAENPYSKDTTGMTFTWYKVNAGGDVKVAEGSATFAIPTVHDADAGQYYCVVTLANPATGTTSQSSNVTLKIKHIVGYWPFDGDFEDKVGNNDGSPRGTPLPSFVPGIIGQAIKFDGLDGSPAQAVTVPTTGLPVSSFTLSFWEKAPNNTRAGYMLASGAGTGFERLYMWRRTGNVYYGNFNGGSGPTGSMGQLNATFPENVWHLNVLTYDSSRNLYRWFVDGRVQPSQSSASGDHTPPTPFTDWDSLIFIANRRSMNRAYQGLFDDFSFFDYPMEPLEVAEFYLKTVGGYFCWTSVTNDLNGDCVISIADLALMASEWTSCHLVPASACN